jgi:hypothetical protein
MEKQIDIVSFTIPYPATYGGVIDVFYRIKALKEIGYQINLHCFKYNKDETKELNKYCKEVFYYQRKTSFLQHFSFRPYIVQSRAVPELLENLKKTSNPILFEGLHSSYFLNHPDLKKRVKIVRAHNIEHEYYAKLALQEKRLADKAYFFIESQKLKFYEKRLRDADAILAISEADHEHFKQYAKTIFAPPFHPFFRVDAVAGRGNYVLYHGNLSVPENHQVAMFIVQEIAPYCSFDFCIAGYSPNTSLEQEASKHSNIKLLANPTDAELYALIGEAHINLLPTFQDTGFKLKLLYALYRGRFCLVNPTMVKGTGLSGLCHVANNAKEIISITESLFGIDFSTERLAEREQLLNIHFQNNENANKIHKLITMIE